MAFKLTARIGSNDLRVSLTDGEYVVGSAPDNDVVLPDPTVSRCHARLIVNGTGLTLYDADSRNGTHVNGRRIAEAVELRAGDRLAFGHAEAVIETMDEDELESAIGGDAGGSDTPADVPGPGTLASGEFARFCIAYLSPLIARLGEGEPAAAFAARLADALARSARGSRFEIRCGGGGPEDGVMAAAGEAPANAASRTHQRDGWSITVQSTDEHGNRVTLEALVTLALSLLALVGVRDIAQPAVPAAAIVGESPPLPEPATQHEQLAEIYRQAARVARGRISVLIEGESGTGKELLARYLHAAAGPAPERLVALNCASLPRDLLEAELFGIEKGVATGVEARRGKFELAHGGTLFLDEIGDMAPETQAKILRVLQEKQVYRVGGREARPADVRVVSATNRRIEEMIDSGAFRRDLYHRIADWTVTLPPLRRRMIDLPNLAGHFLARACAERGIRFGGISKGALETLKNYPWPGNVRELEREMARVALFLNDGEMLASSMLQERIRQGGQHVEEFTLDAILTRAEKRAVGAALEDASGNVAEAAAALGLGRSTLYRRIKELGLED